MRSLLDHEAIVLFVTLFALYSPLAALSSYFPVLRPVPIEQHARLGLGLFIYVAVFALSALWIGEYLLVLLGISTSALVVTGGVALLIEAVPMMMGSHPEGATVPNEGRADVSWRSVLLVPVTFPLTVGGTTFAILVAFSAAAANAGQRGLMTVAVLAYAAVTGLTLFASGHVGRRASARTADTLERIAGILLTAIAATLLASGITRLVVEVLHGLR